MKFGSSLRLGRSHVIIDLSRKCGSCVKLLNLCKMCIYNRICEERVLMAFFHSAIMETDRREGGVDMDCVNVV